MCMSRRSRRKRHVLMMLVMCLLPAFGGCSEGSGGKVTAPENPTPKPPADAFRELGSEPTSQPHRRQVER